MKAVISATEALLFVGLTVISASLLFTILPNQLADTSKLIALSSAEAIAKDIAGLVTVSASSPFNITLYYELPKNISFNISLKNRLINLTLSTEFTLIKDSKVVVENATAKMAVDAIAEMQDVKKIEIEKIVENGENKYFVRKYE